MVRAAARRQRTLGAAAPLERHCSSYLLSYFIGGGHAMGLLRLAVLGPPEVVHDGSRLTFAMGAPLTQPLTNRASEALCWALLALAQVHAGQVQPSIRSGRRALALSKE